ncbi:MAG: hypothetical protein HYW77_01485 [Parcubacteria group bacterium]|nr:hypothetical protein [Parcubacteria group bacterium]
MSVKFILLARSPKYQPKLISKERSFVLESQSLGLFNLLLLGVLIVSVLYFVVQSNLVASKKLLLQNLNQSMEGIYVDNIFKHPLISGNIQELKSALNMIDVDILHSITLDPNAFALGSTENLTR